jgi:glycosyltransferase involved in cell wall biosynthesis
MKNALVLVFSNLKHDARVRRQVDWLRKFMQVTVVCFGSDEIAQVRIVQIRQTKLSYLRKAVLAAALATRAYNVAYRLFHSYHHVKDQLKESFDVVIANDIDTLPLAFQLQPNARIIFDAHEYAPRHFENNRVWKIFFQPFYVDLCRRYIPRVSGMLTVGKGLADEYEKNFGVKPVIITNATRYHEVTPSSLQDGKIRLIHHGIANPSRRLELMVEMMSYLDERFMLDMILMVSDFASPKTKSYVESFMRSASENPRIRFLPSVPSDRVVETINQYDIGVFLIPPINFNYANTLPNKLFDYIQARLGVAIGPTPEMASIVNHYQNGVVSDNFEPRSLAEKLNALTPEQVLEFKARSAEAAKTLNAENNEVLFKKLIDAG